MAWRAAQSLLVLHRQLQTGAPAAAPPATDVNAWGLIGDAEHDPTSDHAPHDFSGWGNDIVTAADFPNAPTLGLDAHRVLEDIRRSRDTRVKYAISRGQMFSSYTSSTGIAPWTWRTYSGRDGHFTHGHLSVVGSRIADDPRPWATIGGNDMLKDERLPNTSSPGMGDRDAAMALSDIWNAIMRGKTMGGNLWADSPFTKLLANTGPLTDEQALAVADRIALALVARTDNPLGDADKPAIVAAVKQALIEGVGSA